MTTLSPEHRAIERGRDSEIRERRSEQKRQTKGSEGVCRGKERKRHKRKGKKERKGKERKRGGKRKKAKERGRKGLHEQPSRKCEAPLPCQPALATSHTHTHRFAPTMVMFSLSLTICSLSLSYTHTRTASNTLIFPLSSYRIIRTKVQQQPGQTGSVSAHTLGRSLL